MSCRQSSADYSSENVSPLIEALSAVVGAEPANMIFRYNVCNSSGDYLDVGYNSAVFTSSTNRKVKKSKELKIYERAAKKSRRLRKFEAASEITFFKN